MQAILVEMNHPKYGFERFKIKIIQRYAMKRNKIEPRNLSKRPQCVLGGLYVGANVSSKEIENYVTNFYRERNLLVHITTMKIVWKIWIYENTPTFFRFKKFL